MLRRAPGSLAALGWVLLPMGQLFAQVSSEPWLAVTGVRFWTLGDVTRVVVEVTGEFDYRGEKLPNPHRIYFDLFGCKPRLGAGVIEAGGALLQQIRVAETQPGVTRVVLDLAGPAEYLAAQLANPSRLIVELRATKTATLDRPPTLGQTPGAPTEPRAAESRALGARPSGAPVGARPSPTGTPSLVRALGLKVARVVLDPGHGGHDTGTVGPTGLAEKDLVLDVARRLGALLEERLGAEVIYTRTDDSFVSLERRTEIANQSKADLFLSIHANAGSHSASGVETYFLSLTTSREALEVAARENATSEKTIHELEELVRKIALQDKVEESREFAKAIQSALHRTLSGTSGRDRGVRKAPFLVLLGASMPSVLAEIGFLSNPREERLLKRPAQRQRIAEGLFRGIASYAATLGQFQAARAAAP
ncbi:MAG: N-acetylmuramoyl-L-alanine amidase [Bryobacterales bacterium]|nr:N-acetylmuramoyl-L-alanine amidase [Bryobacteraceae bacterium]MDW8353127.1 N-acetylmuramoyl-L-alanine amidase [Bryobacterales bacterium]